MNNRKVSSSSSSDNFPHTTSSSNTNIPAELLSKLLARPMQNFSAILNSPTDQTYSYYDSIINLFYSTIYYDEKASLDIEINKTLDKLTSNDIQLTTSTTSFNALPNETFKSLLTSPSISNINTSSSTYKSFKNNHFPLSLLHSSSTVNNDNSHIYQSNVNLITEIDDHFFKDESQFKIQHNILELKGSQIETQSKRLIEQCGNVEYELEKTMQHSLKLQEYITYNLQPVCCIVNDLFLKIHNLKRINTSIRDNYFNNSCKLVIKQVKRKNIITLKQTVETIHKLKEVLDLLKVLITNPKKYQLTYDLIIKGKQRIDEFKKNKKVNYQLLTLFDDNYNKYLTKVTEQMQNELTNAIISYFDNSINIITSECSNTSQIFNVSDITYNKLISSSNKLKYILNNIHFNNNNKHNNDNKALNQIKAITTCFIKSEVINTFYLKLRGVFTNVANDQMKMSVRVLRESIINGKGLIINNNITNNNNNVNDSSINSTVIEDNEKNEQCLLLCIVKRCEMLIEGITAITNEILSLLTNTITTNNDDNKRTDVLKRNFTEECNEILSIINKNNIKYIHNQLVTCLTEAINHSHIDSFAENYFIIKDILHITTTTPNKQYEQLFMTCVNEYINKWMNSTLHKIKNNMYQNWEHFNEIPFNYQHYINTFVTFKPLTSQSLIESISHFQNIESFQPTQPSETSITNYITISTHQLKCNQCSLDIIKISYEILKLFSFFPSNSYDIILAAYSALLNAFAQYQNEYILIGKNTVVSQNEISMTYSIIQLITQLRNSFIQSELFVNIKETLITTNKRILNEFIDANIYETMLHSAKCKITELLDIHCVNKAIKELNSITLPNYPVVNKVNEYALNYLKSIKNIYESMCYAYDDAFIVNNMKNALDKFITRIDTFITNGKRIENESSITQFKNDMTFLKKNITVITKVDMNEYKERLNQLIRKVKVEHGNTAMNSNSTNTSNNSNKNKK